ncbi:MAG: hypothetical protein WCK17_13890 [Verrucomicrobiota bacterium]
MTAGTHAFPIIFHAFNFAMAGATSNSILPLVFNIFLNLVLVAALGGFVYGLYLLVTHAPSTPEKVMRLFAVFGGALVALGSNAVGKSYAAFAVDAFSGTRPAGGPIKFLLASVGAGAGVALGWYITNTFKKNRDSIIALRILCFVGTLSLTSFGVVYAEAFQIKGVSLGAAVIPNMMFLTGVILYTVFKFIPDPPKP